MMGVAEEYSHRHTALSRVGGTYALLLYLARQTQLDVGRLGCFSFPAGYYLYLGSALGGLEARLGRHLRRHKKLHWHIDYLMGRARALELWWQGGGEKRECAWAALARKAPRASLPVPGFGSSDCRCPGHLMHFLDRPSAKVLGANISKLEMAAAALAL